MIRGTFHGGDRSDRLQRRAPAGAGLGGRTGCRSPGSTRPAARRIRAGSVTGGPGRNAAIVMLSDLGGDPRGGDGCCPTRGSRPPLTTGRPASLRLGVDYNDFVRTTGRIERWEAWLDAWIAPPTSTSSSPRTPRPRAEAGSAGEAYLHAAVCQHFGKFVWVLDAAAPRRDRASDRALAKAHALLDPTAERIEAVLDGGVLVGNLRRPRCARLAAAAGPADPRLDSTKEEFFHWEEAFLARGMATLSMDGPGQGESGFCCRSGPTTRSRSRAMLDALAGRDDLDLDRVGAAGVSLGGYYAPRAAAFEPRIRAVAGISGPYGFGELWDDLPPLTRATFRRVGRPRRARGARARARSTSPACRAVDQPALFVTGGPTASSPGSDTERAARRGP